MDFDYAEENIVIRVLCFLWVLQFVLIYAAAETQSRQMKTLSWFR